MPIRISLLILFSFILGSATLFGQETDPQKKLDYAYNIISSQYVDDVKESQLVEDAIQGMLKKLDPHSVYIPAKRVDEENQKLASEFEGIGIQFNILQDTIMVVSPIAGGPSEKLGIQSGDKIVTIDGENVAGTGITNDGVRERLLGEKGTIVEVQIKRPGVKELLDFTITRDKIPLYSVDASYMATPKIGYIKVNRFAASTAEEFRKAIKELKKEGMEHLVLDLTGNGGGYLYAAFEMADEFLEWGKMIVYTEGEYSPKRELRASSRGNFEDGKLVVLVDEGSASASEIVTGAIQDWDRGLVIGRRTFGKGLVQKPYRLPDNSEIRLTIARYYTPTGRSIQKSYEEGRADYYQEIRERYEHGEMTELDSIHVPDSLKYYTPNRRIVYGGGGILPDIFIPLDTMPNTSFMRTISRKGLLNQFMLSYVDKHRKQLEKKYPDVATLKKELDIDPIVDEFLAFAEEKSITPSEEEWERSGKLVSYQLKGLLARNLFDVSAYYQVFNDYRKDYTKAIEVLKDQDIFKDMRVHN